LNAADGPTGRANDQSGAFARSRELQEQDRFGIELLCPTADVLAEA
jgi:hypothetical protein